MANANIHGLNDKKAEKNGKGREQRGFNNGNQNDPER